MLNRAILVATNPGKGFNGHDVPAPLVEIEGMPLIKRSLLALERQGITEVVVVVGYRGEEIRRSVQVDTDITNNIIWIETSSGGELDAETLLRVRPYLDGPTVLLGGQLVFSPQALAPLTESSDRRFVSTLLVDHNLSRVFDPGATTKVTTDGSSITAVARDLDDYDAVSVGVGVVQPELLDSLDESDHRRVGLDDLFGRALADGTLRAVDVGESHWQDVTSPETRLHAEWLVRAYGPELGAGNSIARVAATPSDPKRTLSYIEGLLSEKNARHYVLFNPGPVLTSPRVKSALVHHDVCHRDSDYSLVLRRLQHKLRRVCKGGPEHDIVLLSGSGTAAMEAAIASCIPADGKLLVVSNGAFGERFTEITRVHRIKTVHLRYDWGQLIDVDDVRQAIENDPEIVAAVMCHHETSVGILNPVQQVGRVCRSLDKMFFVDAISSLAGEDIDVRRDKIDVLISSANKCLHAISGVSFACVHNRIWPRIRHIEPRVYYLDLRRYHAISQSLSQTPFTPAVSNFFALDAALDELLQAGVESRVRHYRLLNRRIREALRRLGLQTFTSTGYESHSITTIKTPPYMSFTELYDEMKRRGYIVYGCKDALKGKYFQIANMGHLNE